MINNEINKLVQACEITKTTILLVTMIENRAVVQFESNEICYLTFDYDKNMWINAN